MKFAPLGFIDQLCGAESHWKWLIHRNDATTYCSSLLPQISTCLPAVYCQFSNLDFFLIKNAD
jgi:hypothetical protein